MKRLVLPALFAIAAFTAMPAALGASVYTQRPDDKSAVYLTREAFGAHADGVGDDSAALQAAIDRVQSTRGEGIVFVPEGHYRLTGTVYVWPSIRVIGYGAHRPVFTLGANTPGFQTGLGYMVVFTGGRPEAMGGAPSRYPRLRPPAGGLPAAFPGSVPANSNIIDANPGTFYSAMSNIDFEIGAGNPAAVGIRLHYAQHCFVTHMDFHIGSGLAALQDVGNEAEDLHFFGGQVGIITGKPSPGWQFTLLDSSFEGQREAAIREHEAGLTLVRDSFRNVPSAIVIDPGYAEELWVENTRFEHITGPAVVISNENNERTEINLHDVVCRGVPTFASFRESGTVEKAPSETYRVLDLSHGLEVTLGGKSEITTTFHTEPLHELPPLPSPAIAALPDSSAWTNVQTVGVKGDGVTDDTDALEAGIAKYRVLYLPTGRYLVRHTLMLRPDTVLVGLHPSSTQIDLADRTPAFDGAGGPVALLATPAGGVNIVSGIGLSTGGINRRAVGALWRAGKGSLMDDVRFLGGHGTNAADGKRMNPYNMDHSGDPEPARRWDGQYPSLWITDGGGGTFADIWTPDTYAQAGMVVSNTETEGHVYELSSEHHVRTEIKLDHAANWELLALQTEEEHGESPFALPLEIDNSRNIVVANMHSYRVVGMLQTFPYAIRVSHSEDIRFRNLHVDSDSKVAFDDSVYDADNATGTRFHELEALNIPGVGTSTENAASPRPERLTSGFFNISGAVADAAGRVYFVDAHWQKIYRWSGNAPGQAGLETISDAPLDPVNLAIDRAGNLMVISYAGKGTVYSLKPDAPGEPLTVLTPQPSAPRAGSTAYAPDDFWAVRGSLQHPEWLHHDFQYISPDGSAFFPAGRDFVEGALYYGTKMSEVLRSFSLAKAEPGTPFYITDEEEHKTYKADVGPDGDLSNLKLFAERGGEGVVAGPDGKVYIAAGEVYVYSADGKLLETIDVPERPTDLIFGGSDGHTLFILARTSLYSLQR